MIVHVFLEDRRLSSGGDPYNVRNHETEYQPHSASAKQHVAPL